MRIGQDRPDLGPGNRSPQTDTTVVDPTLCTVDRGQISARRLVAPQEDELHVETFVERANGGLEHEVEIASRRVRSDVNEADRLARTWPSRDDAGRHVREQWDEGTHRRAREQCVCALQTERTHRKQSVDPMRGETEETARYPLHGSGPGCRLVRETALEHETIHACPKRTRRQ